MINPTIYSACQPLMSLLLFFSLMKGSLREAQDWRISRHQSSETRDRYFIESRFGFYLRGVQSVGVLATRLGAHVTLCNYWGYSFLHVGGVGF